MKRMIKRIECRSELRRWCRWSETCFLNGTGKASDQHIHILNHTILGQLIISSILIFFFLLPLIYLLFLSSLSRSYTWCIFECHFICVTNANNDTNFIRKCTFFVSLTSPLFLLFLTIKITHTHAACM